MTRKTEKMHVPVEFFKFVREKKAEDPVKFRTNYDVFDNLMGKEDKKTRGNFFGKF